MFVDQADIQVIAGHGGNGCVSFRREKYIPLGGPDGGDGGRGGSVFLEAVHGVDTLLDMVGRHHWRAEPGAPGRGKKQAGKDGQDLIIRVPPGTLVYDRDSGLLLADLKASGQRVLVAKGGKGGKGNLQYTNPVRQAPDFAEPGGKGQARHLHLELRLIADVGLVGLPNAGKSTLLSRLSAARPKIADYPFTTLTPQLGIAELDVNRRLVLADIPGLIEGASHGAGLGLDFLRHIERTRVIVHLIDVLPLDGSKPIESYHQIRRELEAYSPKLARKPEILVANKMDLEGAQSALADLRDQLPGKQIFAISAVAGTGLRPLLEAVWRQAQAAGPAEPFLEKAPQLLAPEAPAQEAGATIFDDDLAATAYNPEIARKAPKVKGLLDLGEAPAAAEEPETIYDHGAPEPKRARRTAAERRAGHRKLIDELRMPKPPAPKPAPKPTGKKKPVAKSAKPIAPDADPELAAEIAAIKADDLRKGKYYGRGRGRKKNKKG